MSGRSKAPKVPPPHYEVGDRVLCFHGPLLYEAKVLTVKPGTIDPPTSPQYKVHYKGWKSSWDEWVPQDRALKWSEENLTLQKNLREEHLPKKKGEKKKDTKSGTDEPTGPAQPMQNNKKRPREMDMDKEEDYNRRLEIRMEVPDNLKSLLVDDWEYITKLGQHVPLPRDPNVADVLDDYRNHAKNSNNSPIDPIMLDELTAGLKLYFNKALGTRLLYRHEREQYANIRLKHPDKEMHEIYGAEHLARMFVIMPELVAHTNLDIQSTNVLKSYLEDMLTWMESNHAKYFLPGYEGGTPPNGAKTAAAKKT